MIQRKQSLYLFIAALLNAGVLLFDQYRYTTQSLVNGVTVSTPMHVRVSDHYPSLLITLVMTLLPLITIFMFSNRKRQIGMSAVSMIATLSFIAMSLTRITHLDKMTPPPTNGSYWIGSVLPAVSVILLILALIGIRRDEKLVKSVDRLR